MAFSEAIQQSIENILSSLGPKIQFTDKDIKIEVSTGIEGSLSVLGSAPQLTFQKIEAELHLGKNEITGRIFIDPSSIQVISNGIEAKDQSKILDQVHNKLFEISKYPEITFDISGLSTSFGPGVALLKGTLTFHGTSQRVAVPLRILGKDRLTGSLMLLQSDFGITPLTAFAGMLRSKDEVKISFDVVLPSVEGK